MTGPMPDRRPRVLRLHHLLLQSADLEKATAFYLDLLGLTVKKREAFRDGRPLIVTEQGIGLTDGRPAGIGPLEHLALEATDVAALAAEAQVRGFSIVDGPAPSAYGISLYLEDPDGNKVELFERVGEPA